MPGASAMYARARTAASRLPGSSIDSGSGTMPSIVTLWLGFVPHVTYGRSAAASISTSESNVAPSSVGSDRQSSSARSQSAPCGACGTALDVGERGVVGRDHARARAGLDRHVADGHAPLHRERADRRPAVLDDVTDAAVRADAGDDPQDHVLRRDAGRELPLDRDGHGVGFRLRKGLRGQDVLDLRRPDADREGAERAVRGGVRVAAHDHQSRLRVALLGSDHVDDALTRRPHREERDAELRGVRGQRIHLPLGRSRR